MTSPWSADARDLVIFAGACAIMLLLVPAGVMALDLWEYWRRRRKK